MLYSDIEKRKKQNEPVMKQEGMNATLCKHCLKTEHEMQNQLAQNNQRFTGRTEIPQWILWMSMMMSRYIATMQKFKKNIYNMIVSGMIDSARKALNLTSDTEEYMRISIIILTKPILHSPRFPRTTERIATTRQADRNVSTRYASTRTRIYAPD